MQPEGKISFWSRDSTGDRLGLSYTAGAERGRCHMASQETRRKADEAPSFKKDEKEVGNLYTTNFTSASPRILDK